MYKEQLIFGNASTAFSQEMAGDKAFRHIYVYHE